MDIEKYRNDIEKIFSGYVPKNVDELKTIVESLRKTLKSKHEKNLISPEEYKELENYIHLKAMEAYKSMPKVEEVKVAESEENDKTKEQIEEDEFSKIRKDFANKYQVVIDKMKAMDLKEKTILKEKNVKLKKIKQKNSDIYTAPIYKGTWNKLPPKRKNNNDLGER